jgi:hypothetical protein
MEPKRSYFIAYINNKFLSILFILMGYERGSWLGRGIEWRLRMHINYFNLLNGMKLIGNAFLITHHICTLSSKNLGLRHQSLN